jgi:predicted secreted protein
MATLTGNNGRFWLDNTAGGTLKEVVSVRNFSIEITSDTIEKTTMGNDTRQFLKGLSSYSGSADLYFDTANFGATATGNIITILNPAISSAAVGDSTASFEVYLNETSNKLSGEVIVTGFTINSSMDGMVEASVSFQGSGALTYTA